MPGSCHNGKHVAKLSSAQRHAALAVAETTRQVHDDITIERGGKRATKIDTASEVCAELKGQGEKAIVAETVEVRHKERPSV